MAPPSRTYPPDETHLDSGVRKVWVLTGLTRCEILNQMVNRNANLDAVFSALGDTTRRRILERLSGGEATVSELAEPFHMTLPAVSKHLKVLERSGLLVREVDGRVHRMRLDPAGLRTAAQWVEHYRTFWEQQFDRLSLFLEKPDTPRREPGPRHEPESEGDEE